MKYYRNWIFSKEGESDRMEKIYEVLITIIIVCVGCLAILLVRECLGDVLVWLLKRILKIDFKTYLGEIIELKECPWGEVSIMQFQDEDAQQNRVCIRRKHNDRIGDKCTIGVSVSKPWIAVRQSAYIPTNLWGKKMMVLVCGGVVGVILAVIVKQIEPIETDFGVYSGGIALFVVMLVLYPFMYWNHINSQKERKEIWENEEI